MAFPLLITLLPALAAAHYQVLVPTPLGTNIEGEETSPCGGYTPDLSSTHNVHVSGESFVMRSSHPQSNWLLRATLDPTANKDWVQIYPIFMQTGLGQFCVSDVGIPTDFVGQKGVVGIVANGGDGLLYQVCLFYCEKERDAGGGRRARQLTKVASAYRLSSSTVPARHPSHAQTRRAWRSQKPTIPLSRHCSAPPLQAAVPVVTVTTTTRHLALASYPQRPSLAWPRLWLGWCWAGE